MNRRKTVSVTPAIGASTVAGAIWTPPMDRRVGTRPATGAFARPASEASQSAPAAPLPTELSQDFRTGLFYLAIQTKAPAAKRGPDFQVYPW